MLRALLLLPLLFTTMDLDALPERPAEQEVFAVAAGPSFFSSHDVDMMANIIWNEARGIEDDDELACVGWVICNRVDAGYGSLEEVMTAPGQFAYAEAPRVDGSDPAYIRCRQIAEGVLEAWSREQCGETDVGRVLPREYMWFSGDGERNWFRDAYKGGEVWDWEQ